MLFVGFNDSFVINEYLCIFYILNFYSQYHVLETRAYFYIKGSDEAETIRNLSRRLSKPDGHKLIFHVSPSSAPIQNTLSPEDIEKLKVAIYNRLYEF